MKIYSLVKQQLVRKPLEEVFPFFERPENLETLTPPNLDFFILTPSPIRMKTGALIDYTIRLMGINMRWSTLITDYEPPFRFVDEQLKGPYSYWHHTHTFRETDDGTWIMDEVRYVVPFGLLGKILHGVFIRRMLEKIFAHRAEVIRSIFEESAGTAEKGIAAHTMVYNNNEVKL
jgi:ligand-binding SRPBCC domain-containing protein